MEKQCNNPGDALKELMDSRGLTPYSLSLKCDLAPVTIQSILHNQREITKGIAKHLEYFGYGMDWWLAIQKRYRKCFKRRNLCLKDRLS